VAAGAMIVLDDGLAPTLAAELRARGRAATTVAELGLEAAPDAAVLAAVAARGAILIALREPGVPVAGARVAVVAADRTDAERRDVVHRHAHAITAQRSGLRVYG
jgi:hypothetical protein